MKNLFRKIIPALLLTSLLGGSAWAQGRMATVDVRKVFDGYWKKKQAEAQLKDRQADIEKEDKNMLEDYRQKKKEYDELLKDLSDGALSQEEKDKRRRAAEDKLKSLKDLEVTITQYENTARTTIMEQTDRMRANIITDIKNVVTAKAKAAGYSMVVDTAAESVNKTPVVLYSNNENDLTDAVLAQLNANAPAATSEKPDKPTAAEEKKGKK